MKIDAYNTLTSMAKCLQNDENAENSPFVLVAESNEAEKASVTICASAEKTIQMYAALTAAVVDCLKDELPELVILDIMAKTVSVAMGRAFGESRGRAGARSRNPESEETEGFDDESIDCA